MTKNVVYIACMAMLTLSVSSCDGWLNGSSNSTPTAEIFSAITNTGDTLGVIYDKKEELTLLDTTYVGDTIRFFSVFQSGPNNLIEVIVECDEDYGTLVFAPKDSLDKVFNDDSDYEKGIFRMDIGTSLLTFPFEYVSHKAGDKNVLEIIVESDADIDGHIQSRKLPMRVIARPDDESGEE